MSELNDQILQLNIAPEGVSSISVPVDGNLTKKITHQLNHPDFQAVGKSAKQMRWRTPASELKEYFRHYMPNKYLMDEKKYKHFFEDYVQGPFTHERISNEIRQAYEGNKLLAALSHPYKFL